MGGGGAAELQRPSIHTLKGYRRRRGPFGHGSPALLPLSTRCFQSRRAEAGDTLTLTQPQRLIFWNCLYKLTLGRCTLLWIGCFFGGGGILPPIPQGSTACTLFLMGQGLWLIASLNTDGYWAAAAAHISESPLPCSLPAVAEPLVSSRKHCISLSFVPSVR